VKTDQKELKTSDRKRLHCYVELARHIGCDPDKLASVKPQDYDEEFKKAITAKYGLQDKDVFLNDEILNIKIGGKDYSIKQLRIGKDIQFRKKLTQTVSKVFKLIQDELGEDGFRDSDIISKFIEVFTIELLDEVVELFFLYIEDQVDLEDIKENYPAIQIQKAALEFFEHISPFLLEMMKPALRLIKKSGITLPFLNFV
jgi:hypothetical protein